MIAEILPALAVVLYHQCVHVPSLKLLLVSWDRNFAEFVLSKERDLARLAIWSFVCDVMLVGAGALETGNL